MGFSILLILEIVIVFSFIVTSIYMWLPKGNETVHGIFFNLAVMLAILITVVDATSIPNGMATEIIVAWCGLIFAAIGTIIRVAKGKTSSVANILVMLSSIFGVVFYFVF